MKLFGTPHGTNDTSAAASSRTAAPAGPDSGPVIVLLDDAPATADTLEWAASEAAARGTELRLVRAFQWPRLLDPFGNVTVDLSIRATVDAGVTAAVRRAQRVAPDLRITSRICPGRPAAALIAEARKTEHTLVVLNHDRRSGRLERALTRRLVRRSSASLAVVGLSKPGAGGPSGRRVVVGLDDDLKSPATLGFAFRAARRRSIGLTVVHASLSRSKHAEESVRLWSRAYPEVDVRWSFDGGPFEAAVLAESAAAALTVVSPARGSAAYDVLRLVRGPVVMVGVVSA